MLPGSGYWKTTRTIEPPKQGSAIGCLERTVQVGHLPLVLELKAGSLSVLPRDRSWRADRLRRGGCILRLR